MGGLRANVGPLMSDLGGGSNVFDLLNSAWDFGFRIGDALFGGRKQSRPAALPAWAQQGTPAYGEWSYSGVPLGRLVVIDKATGAHRTFGPLQGAGLALADLPPLPAGSLLTVDPVSAKRGVLNAAAVRRAVEGCPPPRPAPPPIVLAPPANAPQILSIGALRPPGGSDWAAPPQYGRAPNPFLNSLPLQDEECAEGYVESDGVCIPQPAPEPEPPAGDQVAPPPGSAAACVPLCASPSGALRADVPRPPRAPRRVRPINVNVTVKGCCK